jgi:hypothetical protein
VSIKDSAQARWSAGACSLSGGPEACFRAVEALYNSGVVDEVSLRDNTADLSQYRKSISRQGIYLKTGDFISREPAWIPPRHEES